jgi:hypothetical protein
MVCRATLSLLARSIGKHSKVKWTKQEGWGIGGQIAGYENKRDIAGFSASSMPVRPNGLGAVGRRVTIESVPRRTAGKAGATRRHRHPPL